MGGHHHRVGDTMMMQSVGDARYPQRIFDTLWILVRSDWSRLGATVQATDLFRTHGRSHQGATPTLLTFNERVACLLSKKKTEHLR